MQQYFLFASFSALYICSILAGTVYDLPGGKNLMIMVVFMMFVLGMLKMTDAASHAAAKAPSPPIARTISAGLHFVAMILLAWHGWFVLAFLVIIAAVCKLINDYRGDELRKKLKPRPAKDIDLTELNTLARLYATDYASPHHFTLSVSQLRNLINEYNRTAP